jgi:hypothetical protein
MTFVDERVIWGFKKKSEPSRFLQSLLNNGQVRFDLLT